MEKTIIDSLMATIQTLSRENPMDTYVLYIAANGERYVIENTLYNYHVYKSRGYVRYCICIGGVFCGTA